MSDFPFKKGDLVSIRSSFYVMTNTFKQGIIVSVKEDGWFDVLIDDKVEQVHRNYLVTPSVTAVKVTGGHR